MINPQLLDYVRQQLAASLSKEEIAKALATQGWSQQDIDEVFNAVASQAVIKRKFSWRASFYGIIGFLAGTVIDLILVKRFQFSFTVWILFVPILLTFIGVILALKFDKHDSKTATVPIPVNASATKERRAINSIFGALIIWDIIFVLLTILPLFLLPKPLADSFANSILKYANSYLGLILSLLVSIFAAWTGVRYAMRKNYIESSMSATRIAVSGCLTYFFISLIQHWGDVIAGLSQTPIPTVIGVILLVAPVIFATRYFIIRAQRKLTTPVN